MNVRKTAALVFSAVCMIILILDTRTAIQGAVEGIDICIRSLIPSLFPFSVFSALMTAALLGQPIRILQPLAKICRIPHGSESLLAIGFLGGYPLGAQNAVFAWEKGCLTTEDARRMMVFCSNAGPAFIFGFLGQMFQRPLLPWILWLIHIASAVITGFLIPGGTDKQAHLLKSSLPSLPDILDSSVRVMAKVCSWVVLFRIFLEFLRKWLFWYLPSTAQIFITGILELSNGCLMLQNLSSDGLRLIFGATFLGFGGFCVLLQTFSIAHGLSISLYLPGKFLQGAISFLLSYGVHFLIIPNERIRLSPFIPGLVLLITIFSAVIIRNTKKSVAISEDLLYNEESCEKRRVLCCFGKRSNLPAPTVSTVPK